MRKMKSNKQLNKFLIVFIPGFITLCFFSFIIFRQSNLNSINAFLILLSLVWIIYASWSGSRDSEK